jgi:hypothetical protein
VEDERDESLVLAVVFGVASVPWTYAFVVSGVPLWPSFISSASYYASDGSLEGLAVSYANNFAGILYAGLTLVVVETYLGGAVLGLSLVVGFFMFIASLHDAVVGFAPAVFLGYATMFSVHAAGVSLYLSGVPGEAVGAFGSMFVGAAIGIGTDIASGALGQRNKLPSR